MPKGIASIIESLKNNSLIILHFKDDCIHDAQLDDGTFAEFCTALANNTSLSTLDFTNCAFPANINFAPFFLALQNNKALKSLSFSGTTFGDSCIGGYMKELSQALSEPDGNTSLTTLDLSNSKINNKHIEELTFLKNNHHLTSVNLEKNEIMPGGIAILARQLKHYPKHLSLYPVAANSDTLKKMPVTITENAQNDKLLELRLDGNNLTQNSKHYHGKDILEGINIALKNNKPIHYVKSNTEEKLATETTDPQKKDCIQNEDTIHTLLHCDIILLSSPPSTNAAFPNPTYIRVKNKNLNTLFYVNNNDDEFYEIKLAAEKLQLIDEKVKPNEKARTLSETELNQICSIINPNATAEENNREKNTTESIRRINEKKKRKANEKPITFSLPRLTSENNHPTHFKSTAYTIKKETSPEEIKTKHIRWFTAKFTQGGAAIGLFVVTGLMIAGLFISGPVGWAILASIVAGATLFGAVVGSIIGVATAPKEIKSNVTTTEFTNNTLMTRELTSARPRQNRFNIILPDEDSSSEDDLRVNSVTETISPETPLSESVSLKYR